MHQTEIHKELIELLKKRFKDEFKVDVKDISPADIPSGTINVFKGKALAIGRHEIKDDIQPRSLIRRFKRTLLPTKLEGGITIELFDSICCFLLGEGIDTWTKKYFDGEVVLKILSKHDAHRIGAITRGKKKGVVVPEDNFELLQQNEKKNIGENLGLDLSIQKGLLDEFSINDLQKYIEKHFGKYEKDLQFNSLINEMRMTNTGMLEIENGRKLLINKNKLNFIMSKFPSKNHIPTQTGIIRLILDITNEKFYSSRKENIQNKNWQEFVEKIKIELR